MVEADGFDHKVRAGTGSAARRVAAAGPEAIRGPGRHRSDSRDQAIALYIGIEHMRGAHLHRHVPARLDRIDRDDRRGPGNPGPLHGTQTQRPAAEHSHDRRGLDHRQPR